MKIINAIFGKIEEGLVWVINLLPASPFQAISNSDVSEFLGSLNWVLPISEAIAILQLWIAAVGGFYLYQAVLRWLKAIE